MKLPLAVVWSALLASLVVGGCASPVDLVDDDESDVDDESTEVASSEEALTTTPFPGIQFITGSTSTPAKYFAAKIDLRVAANKVRTTRAADKKTTVSKFAQKYDCKVALNGDFFNYADYNTIGLAMGGGEKWPSTADTASWGFAGFGPGRAEISPPGEVANPVPDWIKEAVGGRPMVVENGEAVRPSDCAPHFCQRHPRSAVGLSRDNKTLILLAVDGRTSTSKGATTFEVGKIMKSLGAWNALNLDGGGSTAMYLKGKGIVNNPSDGRERVVANHIGVCK